MRILLVEDEEKVAHFVRNGLRAESYAVDHSINGRDGLGHINQFEYDLIILDLNLPEVSGADLLKALRKKNTRVPVLILSARDSLADKVKNFEEGADDYLTKPFAFAELLVRVKALLRRGPVNRSSILNVGDLELDRGMHSVKRGNNLIILTIKEFALLEYLMINVGRVLSRAMIIEHVWDQSFEGVTNIVDVYVRQVRKKIDDAYEPKLIRTVRGAGYMIQEESA